MIIFLMWCSDNFLCYLLFLLRPSPHISSVVPNSKMRPSATDFQLLSFLTCKDSMVRSLFKNTQVYLIGRGGLRGSGVVVAGWSFFHLTAEQMARLGPAAVHFLTLVTFCIHQVKKCPGRNISFCTYNDYMYIRVCV